MNKKEFIDQLEKRLKTINEIEREKTLQYYEESINDRMEDGLSEEEAVKALGNIDDIVNNIMCDQSLVSLVKSKVSTIKSNSKSNGTWILFLILGFPLWFPLVLTFIILVFVTYLVIYILMFSFFIVLVAIAGTSFALLIACFIKLSTNGFAHAGTALGMSFILAGLALLLIEPCKEATKKVMELTKSFVRGIKKLFIPKKEA